MFSSNEWIDHILLLIKELNIKELKEYSRFLNLNYRNSDAQDTKNQTIAAPLIFCFITICLSPVVASIDIFSKNICNLVLYIIAMVGIIILFKHLFLLLIKGKEHIYKYFYQDMKEIVDERIEQIKIKGAGD